MKHHAKNTKKKRIWKKAAAAAAVCALAACAFQATNPILAKNMFSSVFGKLIDNSKGKKYEQEDTDKLTKIGSKAVTAEDEAAKQKDPSAYQLTASDQGITISVSDIYCDGYMLYYTASLKTDNKDLNQADAVMVSSSKTSRTAALKIQGMVDVSGIHRCFEKAEDGSFVLAEEINLMSNQEHVTQDENGTFTVEWTAENLTGTLFDKWDAQGEYETTGSVNGLWNLTFPVTIDDSKNETYPIEKEENGITVKEAIKTKAGLILHVELPDFRNAPYNDPYNDPNLSIRDANGSYLQWMSQRHDTHDDGTTESWIMVLYDNEQNLTFEVTTKEEEETKIADIAFQIP